MTNTHNLQKKDLAQNDTIRRNYDTQSIYFLGHPTYI